MKKNIIRKILIRKETGFTIVESLVAIFILILSITGPMSFTQSGLRAAFVSRDQITAFYLAQDAIEYIKNVRDNNAVAVLSSSSGGGNWLDKLDLCFVSNTDGSGCSVDTDTDSSSAFSSCSSPGDGCLADDPNNDKPLKKISVGGGYFLGTSDNSNIGNSIGDSIFSREIKMIKIDPDANGNTDEVEINVFIRWNTNETTGNRQIVVKEYIYNWATAGL